MARATERFDMWHWGTLGLLFAATVWNAFVVPTLSFVAQLEEPPEDWEAVEKGNHIIRAAHGSTIFTQKHSKNWLLGIVKRAPDKGHPWSTPETIHPQKLTMPANSARLRVWRWRALNLILDAERDIQDKQAGCIEAD